MIAPGLASADPARLVVCGDVDHGKSTLIGRLLYETGSLHAGKVAELTRAGEQRGMPIEWSFLLDALQAERDQAVTIDRTEVALSTPLRKVVFIDVPGHREFLRNMLTGASVADAALLVVDVAEGLLEQARRHAFLLNYLGIKTIAVAVNKMDTVGFSQSRYDRQAAEIAEYLKTFKLVPVHVVPVSGRDGDNLASHSKRMPWYEGPTVLEMLDRLEATPSRANQSLRVPVQDVYKFDERRIVVGRIESGRLKQGDLLLFSPSGKTARAVRLESWPGATVTEAAAGASVSLLLDAPIFVERGEIISHIQDPPSESSRLVACIVNLSKNALASDARLRMILATRIEEVVIDCVHSVKETSSLALDGPGPVPPWSWAEVSLHSARPLALDEGGRSTAASRFVLLDGGIVAAIGIVAKASETDHVAEPKSKNIALVAHGVRRTERELQNGHRGGVLWFTGLPASGKSTLALLLEQRLCAEGMMAYVLDGDNIRRGLSSDLGFSPGDRSENLRRVAEVAKLFADAGFVCIAAFISPLRRDRDQARAINGADFDEIYIKASLAACEARDPKGLYKKARAGLVAEFSGVSAPYEPPPNPDLVVDTEKSEIGACVERIFSHAVRRLAQAD